MNDTENVIDFEAATSGYVTYDEYTRRKRKKIIIAIAIPVGLALAFLLLRFMIIPKEVCINEMHDDIRTFIEDEKLYFEYSVTTRESGITSDSSIPVVYDYDNGIIYQFDFMTVTASRYGLWFDNNHTWIDPYNYYWLDGQKAGGRGEYKTPKKGIDYRENPNEMFKAALRVYYKSPDGTFTLLWQVDNADEILEKAGVTINEEDIASYIRKR